VGYEKLVKELKEVPSTYVPALIMELIKIGIKKGVFKDNKPLPFLKTAVNKINEDDDADEEGN